MTWVVGIPTMFGYGTAISDVRVTFNLGGRCVERDMLQKVHPVGQFIVGGFAGSVELGFRLLQDLQEFLQLPAGSENQAWHPNWVAENWSPEAHALFASAQPEQQSLGAEILLVGVSPDEDVGIPGYARAYVAKMSFPSFAPLITQSGGPSQHIGSGSIAAQCQARLDELSPGYHPLMQSEVGADPQGGAFGLLMMHSFARELFMSPLPGVSHHLLGFVVRRGQIGWANTDHKAIDETGAVEIRMPRLARDWEEFCAMSTELDQDPASATC
jgi:hypothetical protein